MRLAWMELQRKLSLDAGELSLVECGAGHAHHLPSPSRVTTIRGGGQVEIIGRLTA